MYSFISYYKKGDLIQAIECLKQGVYTTPGSISALVSACSDPLLPEPSSDQSPVVLSPKNLNLSQFVKDIEIDLNVLSTRIEQLGASTELFHKEKVQLQYVKDKLGQFVEEVKACRGSKQGE